MVKELEIAKEKHRRANVVYYAVINYYTDGDDVHNYFYGQDDWRRKHTDDLHLAAETARKEVQEIEKET